jgi:hypothetical protein
VTGPSRRGKGRLPPNIQGRPTKQGGSFKYRTLHMQQPQEASDVLPKHYSRECCAWDDGCKADNIFRVAFQNVNSFGATHYQHNLQEFAATQQELQIDFIGITEHCLNASQPKVLNNITKTLNRDFRGGDIIQMNSSTIETLSPYLPGGTASILMGNHITRVNPIGKGGDEHGRWNFISL